MLIPNTIEEFNVMKETGRKILFFTADWCPDCVVIKPHMASIEATFPDAEFVQLDRDQFIDVCQEMNVFGIPSFIVLENGQEKGRFVSKDRKTKEEIISFIQSV